MALHRSRRTLRALLACLSLTLVVPAWAATTPLTAGPPQIAANARSYVLLDFDTGQVIASHAADLQLPPASLTKLMTAYLAYQAVAAGRLHWQQRVPVSVTAWHTGGSSMFIQPELPVTTDQLMHGLIIDSGNDAAVALAQAIAGTRAAFVTQMNATAAALGLAGAHYADVDGLPAADLHMSALDIAQLSRDLIRQYPSIIAISARKSYRYGGITQRSWNPALFGHPSVDGLKTGHTQAAGYCMDVTAVRNGRRLIAVVMGAPDWHAAVHDALALLDYGYDFTVNRTVLQAGTPLGSYRDLHLRPDRIALVVPNALTVTVPADAAAQLQTRVSYRAPLAAAVRKGEMLGQVSVLLGDRVLASAPLLAQRSAAHAGFFGTLWNRMLSG